MKELIKKMVERLYYMFYPDRVNDHLIASQPIPIERYKPIKIIGCISLPKDIYQKGLIPEDRIRAELAHNMSKQIEPFISLDIGRDQFTDTYISAYGEIKILARSEGGYYDR